MWYKVIHNVSFSDVRSHFLKMRKSAIWIQKTWRGYQCRKNYTTVRTISIYTPYQIQ